MSTSRFVRVFLTRLQASKIPTARRWLTLALLLVAVLVVAGEFARRSNWEDARGLREIRRIVAKLGGRRAIETAGSTKSIPAGATRFRITKWIEGCDRPVVTYRTLQSDGANFARLDQSGPYRRLVCETPGKAWEDLGGAVRSLPEEGRRDLHKDFAPSRILEPLVWATEDATRSRFRGEQRLPDGSLAFTVEVAPHTDSAVTYYFDSDGAVRAIGSRSADPTSLTAGPDYYLNCVSLLPPDRRIAPGCGLFERQLRYRNGRLIETDEIVSQTRLADPRLWKHPPPPPSSRTSVPMDDIDGYPVIQASVGAGSPARFLVDTGSEVSQLSPDLARRCGVKTQGYACSPTMGGMGPGEYGRVALNIGGLTLPDIAVIVPDHSSAENAWDGVLGYNVLGRFQPTLDFGSHQLLLQPHGSPLPFGAVVRTSGAPYDPLVWVRSGGMTWQASVATGSAENVLPPLLAEKLPGINTRHIPGVVGSSQPDRWEYALPDITVLGRRQKNVAFESFSGAGRLGTEIGVLGARFLAGSKLTIDYDRGVIVTSERDGP